MAKQRITRTVVRTRTRVRTTKAKTATKSSGGPKRCPTCGKYR